MPLDEGKYKSSMLIPTDFLAPGTISISNRIEQMPVAWKDTRVQLM